MPNPLYNKVFQIAYATRDLDAAIAKYKSYFGIREFHTFEAVNGIYRLRVGLAWAGDRMVEILDPQGDVAPLFQDFLPSEKDGLRFHHFGHLVTQETEWREIEQAVADSGLPIASRISSDGEYDIIYTDSRSVDGHYHEYVYAMPTLRDFFDGLPRN